MSEVSSHSLKSNEMVSVLGNLLKLVFFDNSRNNAKRSFRDLEEGKTLRLPALTLPDESRTEVTLTMDCSECKGKVVFSSFKKHLAAVLGRIAKEMEAGNDVPILASEDGMQRVVNLPVAFKNDEHVNVLAAGFALKTAELELKLMYLDPSQFSAQGESAA